MERILPELLNNEGGESGSDSEDTEQEGDRNSQEMLKNVVIECNENPPSLQELDDLVKMKLGKSAGFV
jgi:hypothetical protein